MRGKVACADQTIQPDGITPAWAGKSLFCFTAAVPIQDHPRMGGEKLYCIAAFCSMWGSPPHGRGKAIWGPSSLWRVRITPAWAGKRHKAVLSSGRNGDHPRMGGEKTGAAWRWLMVTGSPPHGRGKGMTSWGGVLKDRITPAWAGKSVHRWLLGLLSADHPRMGGEKPLFRVVLTMREGSPPHGRGKVDNLLVGVIHFGITPAWAGKRRFLP